MTETKDKKDEQVEPDEEAPLSQEAQKVADAEVAAQAAKDERVRQAMIDPDEEEAKKHESNALVAKATQEAQDELVAAAEKRAKEEAREEAKEEKQATKAAAEGARSTASAKA